MNRAKKIWICTALFYLLAGTLNAQSSDEAYRTETFRTTGIPEVVISTQGGFIEVIGTNEDEVIVEMFVRRGSRYLTADEEDLSGYQIEIEQDGNQVVAISEGNSSSWIWGRSLSVSFRVRVPYRSEVEGRTSGGHVSAEYIRNNLNLRTSGGSIRVTDVQGDEINLRTSGGTITLGRVAGSVHAKTSGGSIRGEVLAGQANLQTSGGSIELRDISAQVTAKTSGGRIRAEITRFDEDISLRTSGGSIDVQIASAGDFELDLRGTRVNADLRNFSGSSERGRIKGAIGRGGPLLTASTSGGSINLEY